RIPRSIEHKIISSDSGQCGDGITAARTSPTGAKIETADGIEARRILAVEIVPGNNVMECVRISGVRLFADGIDGWIGKADGSLAQRSRLLINQRHKTSPQRRSA